MGEVRGPIAPSEVSNNGTVSEQLIQEGYPYLITENVQSGTIIGRSPGEGLVINLSELPENKRDGFLLVSRSHIKLAIDPKNNVWYVQNLRSDNKTSVRDIPLNPGAASYILDGSTISLADIIEAKVKIDHDQHLTIGFKSLVE